MRFELHCHSLRSDGAVEPVEVARRARDDGAEVFCLTDHDTTSGTGATRAFANHMTVLRGLELSCHHDRRSVHILVYDTQRSEAWAALEEILSEVASSRRDRIRAMAEKLRARGIIIDADAILERAGDKTVGRPDVARALVEVGAASSMRNAFDRYLHDGGPIDVPTSRLALEEGLEVAVSTGARLSLAHPHVYGPKRAAEIARIAKGLGLSGFEAQYGSYSPAEVAQWTEIADSLGLVVTAGSDFHEDLPGKRGTLGVDVDDERSARLREWLGLS